MKSRKKSRAHLHLTVFHFVQSCFVAEAWVTGSVWAVDGNNIGLFVKDIVFCFRTLFFSIVCLILCLSQDMLHELVSLVLCRLLVVAISPPPPHPTTPRTICFSHCDVFCQESQESILQMEASVGGVVSQFKKLLFGSSRTSFVGSFVISAYVLVLIVCNRSLKNT